MSNTSCSPSSGGLLSLSLVCISMPFLSLVTDSTYHSRIASIHDIFSVPRLDIHPDDLDAPVPLCWPRYYSWRPSSSASPRKEAPGLGEGYGALFSAFPLMNRIFTANYDTAMRVVAYTELVIFVRVVLGAITFQNSLLSPLIYTHFLRQRYFQSAFTREALSAATARIDALVDREGNPPVLVQVWGQAKALTTRWLGGTLAPAPAAAPRR